MADRPMPPWTLQCPWCPWRVVVFGRGARGDNQGAGVEAAQHGAAHAGREHGRTWQEWLEAEARASGAA